MELVAKNKISGRAAQAVVAVVTKSGQTVLFKKDGRTINAASLLGVLSLVIMPGDKVEVIAENNDNIINIISELF